MIRIVHPYPKRGAQKFIGIVFHDGFAHVESLHPEVAAALRQHNFSYDHDTNTVDLRDAPKKKRTKRAEDPAGGIIATPPTNLWDNGDPETYIPAED